MIALVHTGEKTIPALKDQGIEILVAILVRPFGQIIVAPDQVIDHRIIQG